ncbi:hypothetical protein N9018_00655 [Rhodopirellula sp.]|nr:hypothetical protein [Rhodopirellula sp.]
MARYSVPLAMALLVGGYAGFMPRTPRGGDQCRPESQESRPESQECRPCA